MGSIAGIYILKNSSLPDYVKIGYSQDVEETVDRLNSSEATPFPFVIYAVYEVPAGFNDKNCQQIIERLFLKTNGGGAVAKNASTGTGTTDATNTVVAGSTVSDKIRQSRERNFYLINEKSAYQTLLDLAVLHGNEDKLRLFDTSDIEKAETQAVEKMRNGVKFGKKRKGHFRFSMIGLKPGDVIQYRYDPNISLTIVSDNEVVYGGKPYTLSALAMELSGRTYGVQGPAYFCYNGERLDAIRLRMEKEKEG